MFGSCSVKYKITKEDLKAQLLKVAEAEKKDTLEKTSSGINRIACSNSKNKRVWLYISREMKLKITAGSSEKPFSLNMYGMIIRNDSLVSKYSRLIRLDTAFAFSDIRNVEILAMTPYTEPCFNVDSLNKVAELLSKKETELCANDKNQIIQMQITGNQKSILQDDYLLLFAGAVYNLGFNDKVKVKSGLVHKIRNDSIYISNALNENVAKKEKINYKILRYHVKDIVSVDLYHTYNSPDHFEIMSGDFDIKTLAYNQYDGKPCPIYKVMEKKGKILKYYFWLTLSGYFAITEDEGNICL